MIILWLGAKNVFSKSVKFDSYHIYKLVQAMSFQRLYMSPQSFLFSSSCQQIGFQAQGVYSGFKVTGMCKGFFGV